jgi:PKHD-type hydroxylase
MVRDDGDRTLLFALDASVRALTAERADHPVAVQLTAVYHNLLRKWAEL